MGSTQNNPSSKWQALLDSLASSYREAKGLSKRNGAINEFYLGKAAAFNDAIERVRQHMREDATSGDLPRFISTKRMLAESIAGLEDVAANCPMSASTRSRIRALIAQQSRLLADSADRAANEPACICRPDTTWPDRNCPTHGGVKEPNRPRSLGLGPCEVDACILRYGHVGKHIPLPPTVAE